VAAELDHRHGHPVLYVPALQERFNATRLIPRRHIAIGLPHYSLFSIRLIRITVPMPTFTNLAVLCTLIFPARASVIAFSFAGLILPRPIGLPDFVPLIRTEHSHRVRRPGGHALPQCSAWFD